MQSVPITINVVSGIQLRWGVLDTTLCDKVCQWLMAGRWISPGTPVSPTIKIDLHDVTESGVKHHKPKPNLKWNLKHSKHSIQWKTKLLLSEQFKIRSKKHRKTKIDIRKTTIHEFLIAWLGDGKWSQYVYTFHVLTHSVIELSPSVTFTNDVLLCLLTPILTHVRQYWINFVL